MEKEMLRMLRYMAVLYLSFTERLGGDVVLPKWMYVGAVLSALAFPVEGEA